MAYITPETLDGVVKAIPTNGRFFKDTFFKADKVEYTEKISVDFYKGARRVAPFVSPKVNGKVTPKIGYSTDTFTPAYVEVKDVTDIEDIMKRLPAELLQNSGVTPQERATELLTDTMIDFEQQIERREELMCVQSMMDGVIHVKGDGVEYDIDLGFTNKSSVTNKWDTHATPTPINDLRVASSACLKKGLHKPNICIMERTAANAFIRALKLDKEFDAQAQLYFNTQIQPKYVNDNITYLGRLNDPNLEIYVYEDYYIDPTDNTEKSMMPKGKILLASTNAKYSMYYAVMAKADVQTQELISVVGTRMADTYVTKKPDARFLTLASRPLPIPHEIDSWYVLEVSATE